ncbi:MAG: hypothetical protein R3E39_19075 [Anaerolineae bacterium]
MNNNQSSVRNLHHWLALLLVLFSFFMSALVSRTVFERLPHLEDEVAYEFQAQTLTRGQAVIDSPVPARPFWKPFVVDQQGKRFGKYPLGWPALLAAGETAGQPWLVNAWLGVLTVALVYRLGREIYGADTGVLAAALMAFSPMALLLNGTLMGHTAALFTTVLFMYAYWRVEKIQPHSPTFRTSPPSPLSVYREGEKNDKSGKSPSHGLRWAIVAGVALGMTIINRPLAGVAVALPFIVWSGVRLVRSFRLSVLGTQHSAPGTLKPLVVLGGVTLAICGAIPLYQWMATGDARQNLYLLVWPYDQAGFGEGYGRHVHTLEKGLRQTGWDLSLTAADIFGWQSESIYGSDGQVKPELEDHLLNQGDYWQPVGLSWVLLPFGLVIGLGRRWWWWALWLVGGAGLLLVTKNLTVNMLRDPTFAYQWMAGGALWLCVPFVFFLVQSGQSADGIRTPLLASLRQIGSERAAWTWLLLAVPLFLVGLHVAYWIGSQRYSTRYYYEGLAGVALVSAIPLGWLAQQVRRWLVYSAVLAVLLVSLYGYSMPRISVLYRFNWVSPELMQAVEARRTDDRPVLVIVKGTDVRWRSFGRLMIATNPFLDSDIVAAWDNGAVGTREAIIAKFPGRQIIEMQAEANTGCFTDVQPQECYGEGVAAG